jgi:hypothetical protein
MAGSCAEAEGPPCLPISMKTQALLALSLLALSSCSALKKKTKEAPVPEEPAAPVARQIGKISLIHPDYGFVLIQASGVVLPEGSELKVFSPTGQETAKLKSTPARQGSYITADITSGSPKKDDVVMHDPAGTLKPQLAPDGEGKPDPLSLSGYPSIPSPGAAAALPELPVAPVAGDPSSARIPDLPAPAPGSLLPPTAPPPVDDSQLRPVPSVQIR